MQLLFPDTDSLACKVRRKDVYSRAAAAPGAAGMPVATCLPRFDTHLSVVALHPASKGAGGHAPGGRTRGQLHVASYPAPWDMSSSALVLAGCCSGAMLGACQSGAGTYVATSLLRQGNPPVPQ